MGTFYKNIIRPILFLQDQELVQDEMVNMMYRMGCNPGIRHCLEKLLGVTGDKPIEFAGLKFPNPVGIAAGFDKNARAWLGARIFGFGHAEVGTITHHRQAGNPRPRLFRVPEEKAIISKTGFNNLGAETTGEYIGKMKKAQKFDFPVGVCIGKSKAIVNEQLVDDYLASFYLLADCADYISINISSPGTTGLFKLQEISTLEVLLRAFVQANQDRVSKMGCRRVPLFLKISPDLEFDQLDQILSIVDEVKLDGVVASCATLHYPKSLSNTKILGGLSGRPLFELVYNQVKYINSRLPKLPVIATGGIIDSKSAAEMLNAGAKLVQIYAAIVYGGPFVAREIAKGLIWRQKDDWI